MMRTLLAASRALRLQHTWSQRTPLPGSPRKYQLEGYCRGQAASRNCPAVGTRPQYQILSRRHYSSENDNSEAARRFNLEAPLHDGHTVKSKSVSILPTPKAKPEKLTEKLKALLLDGTWQLETLGDAIYTVRYFNNPDDADNAASRIMDAANKLNHHPHVSHFQCALPGEEHQSTTTQLMLITCTTHQPRGLGLRDVSLAKAIDEVLLAYGGGQHEKNSNTGVENTSSRDNAIPDCHEMLLESRKKHRSEIECAVCKN